MESYDVEGNGQKVYVHNNRGQCVARLCKVSGEFDADVYAMPEVKLLCTFDDFKVECEKRYKLHISEEHRPDWAKEPYGK